MGTFNYHVVVVDSDGLPVRGVVVECLRIDDFTPASPQPQEHIIATDTTDEAGEAIFGSLDDTKFYFARARRKGVYIQMVAPTATGGAGVTDHGALTGLADDDHPQYLTPTEHTAIGDGAPHHAEAHALASHSTRVIDNLTDVDTVTHAAAKNDYLKWNGTNWVPATTAESFVFSVATFSDGQTSPLIIGAAGVWKAASAMAFTATYNNGPPTSADVMMSINGGTYNKIGAMTGPNYTTGTNTSDINYPAKDQYLRFRLDASDGTDSDIEYDGANYFQNYRFWGTISSTARASIDAGDGSAEGYVEALSSELGDGATFSKSIAVGSSSYLCVAYPADDSVLEWGDDYESVGNSDFLYASVSLAMELLISDLHITNSAGKDEHYQVYASYQAFASITATLSCSTSTAAINSLYYGKIDKDSGFTETDIEGLEKYPITNDNTQTWDAITCTVEHLLFAFPKRLGIPTFYVGGFEGGFESPETVSVTNSNGWTEDYYVWRSTNVIPGATTVVTQ